MTTESTDLAALSDLTTLLDGCDKELLDWFLRLKPHQQKALREVDLPAAEIDHSTLLLNTGGVADADEAIKMLASKNIEIDAKVIYALKQIQYIDECHFYEVTQITPTDLKCEAFTKAPDIFQRAEEYGLQKCLPGLVLDYFAKEIFVYLLKNAWFGVAMTPILDREGYPCVFEIYKDNHNVTWLKIRRLITDDDTELSFLGDIPWLFVKNKVD